jgi:glycerol-3-phosphate dehydrogenase
MAEELKWSEDEQKRQHAEAVKFVREEMGQQVNRQSRDKIPINLSREEISNYIKRFQALDHDKKGYISINDIRRGLKVCSCCLYYIHQIIIYDKIPLTD